MGERSRVWEKWQQGKPFPPICWVGFGIQTLTPTLVTAVPSFACFDELIMLITSDNEDEQMQVFVLYVKAALTECQGLRLSIPETWQCGRLYPQPDTCMDVGKSYSC